MKKEFFDIGVDAWWLDSTEPALEVDSAICLINCNPCSLGDNKDYLNCYSYNVSKNVYVNQRKCSNDKRVFILTRSGFAGQQANATSIWTGDIYGTWDIFKAQIVSLLGFSMSGIPYSTTDIGGFFVEYFNGNQNPEYRELYTRWFWFGAFSPLFRSHGTSTPREMWFFGEPNTEYYDSQLECSKLRYRLMPYIYSTAFKVYDEDYTIMRPLVMDFPEDETSNNIENSYMFGDCLLVHIITEYLARQQKVYLPKNHLWYDYFTNDCFEGGKYITVDTPLSMTPLFVKEGSIVLTGEDMEYTTQKKDNIINVNIYKGTDCSTFLYQDENDNYNYEIGRYAKINFNWFEKDNLLIISKAIGKPELFDLDKTFAIYVNGKLTNTVQYKNEDMHICTL